MIFWRTARIKALFVIMPRYQTFPKAPTSPWKSQTDRIYGADKPPVKRGGASGAQVEVRRAPARAAAQGENIGRFRWSIFDGGYVFGQHSSTATGSIFRGVTGLLPKPGSASWGSSR